jgi:hypothetical protein
MNDTVLYGVYSRARAASAASAASCSEGRRDKVWRTDGDWTRGRKGIDRLDKSGRGPANLQVASYRI